MALHPDLHDPVITTDADGNYIKTTCRECGAHLDILTDQDALDFAFQVGILEEPMVLEEGESAQIETHDGEPILVVGVSGNTLAFDASRPIGDTNVPPGDHDNPLEAPSAAEAGLESSGDLAEHPDGDSGGKASKASGRNRAVAEPPKLTKRQKAAAALEAKLAAEAEDWDAFVASEADPGDQDADVSTVPF